jgi:hypothetical protein
LIPSKNEEPTITIAQPFKTQEAVSSLPFTSGAANMAKKKAAATQISGDKSMKKTSKRSAITKKKSIPKKARSKKI